MKSVVIARPPFRVGDVGVGAPQMSMKEAIKRYGDPEINSEASPVPSHTVTATTTPTPYEPVEEQEPRPPAFLPPSEDVSGSVVANAYGRQQNSSMHTCTLPRGEPFRTILTNALLLSIVSQLMSLVDCERTMLTCPNRLGSNALLNDYQERATII